MIFHTRLGGNLPLLLRAVLGAGRRARRALPLAIMRRALESSARRLARSPALGRALPSACQLDTRVLQVARGVDDPSSWSLASTPAPRDWHVSLGLAAQSCDTLPSYEVTFETFAPRSDRRVAPPASPSPTNVPTVRGATNHSHKSKRGLTTRGGGFPDIGANHKVPGTEQIGQNVLEHDEPQTWIDKVLPAEFVPYAKLARVDKPIGAHLLMWPCFWSAALAADAGCLPDLSHLMLFATGSMLLRGAGCTINDLWDKDIDAKILRTKTRPLASGAVTQTKALGFLATQLAGGLGVLLQFDDFTRLLGASSLGMIVSYPIMKRITNWPQLFLGLTINWGALVGYAAAHGKLDPTVVLPLYLSGVAWTLVYDTIYAHQDKKDDVKVGVKSTALHFGEDTKEYLGAFAGLAVAGLVGAGAGAGVAWPFYAGVAGAASHLVWQIKTVDLDDPEQCAQKFRSNAGYGALVFAAAVAGKLAA